MSSTSNNSLALGSSKNLSSQESLAISKSSKDPNYELELCKKVFKKYEKTGNGITHDDFHRLCFDFGHWLTDKELKYAIHQIDHNGDNHICIDEFTQWWMADNRFHTFKLTPVEVERLDRYYDVFRKYDKNKDGSLDVSEIQPLFGEMKRLKVIGHTSSILDFISHLDHNNDGIVTFNEFSAWLLRRNY